MQEDSIVVDWKPLAVDVTAQGGGGCALYITV